MSVSSLEIDLIRRSLVFLERTNFSCSWLVKMARGVIIISAASSARCVRFAKLVVGRRARKITSVAVRTSVASVSKKRATANMRK